MSPARILVVEDDRVVARDIEQQLKRIGHIVVGTTASGEQAVALARRERPDLVLMDIRLEGTLDGIAAAQKVRDAGNTPVVFLTAYADDETVSRALQTEPYGYLLKPFEDLQLRTVIEMALFKHSAERKLRESERRYATTLSSIGDAVIATDDQARVTFMNPVAETLTGWPHEEARGRPITEVFRIVNEETMEPVEDPAAKVLRLGITVGLANHTVLLSKDGRILPIDDSGSPIVDDRGAITGAVLVFRDITERRTADEALRQAQADLAHISRLTTMGTLVASISHELAQPVTAMVWNAETCQRWLAMDPPDVGEAQALMAQLIKNGHRARDVISGIRLLAKKAPPEITRVNFNDVVADILKLIRVELLRNNVALETSLVADAGPLAGNPAQLQQVLLNLMMNAVEAMGAITDRPRILRIVSRREEAPRRLLVAIEDTGPGLDAAIRERIFEPFFTTRAEGMGLGLAICRSIVEAHGGALWADANPALGSVFQFTLPLEDDAQDAAASTNARL